MYQPEHFKVEDRDLMHSLMRARPFATLVSAGRLGLYATPLPTVLKDEGVHGVIECHLARANPHWKDLAQIGADGGEGLIIFQGIDGYITPSWYPSKAENQKVVPTWNYAAVHAYGRPAIMEDATWKRCHVAELTDQQERGRSVPWSVSDAPEDYVQVMLRGIVGFRFEIARLEGKWKMSQNRNAQDRAGVARSLVDRGEWHDAEMAELVSSPSARPARW